MTMTTDDDERDSFWDRGPDFALRARVLTGSFGFGLATWAALIYFIRRWLGT
jgi:hypothetical protein